MENLRSSVRGELGLVARDAPVMVDIVGCHHLIQLCRGELKGASLVDANLDFLAGQVTIAIMVEAVEFFHQTIHLSLPSSRPIRGGGATEQEAKQRKNQIEDE